MIEARPLVLAFSAKGYQGPPPYGPGSGHRRTLVEKIDDVVEVAQAGRKLALAVTDILLLLAGLPASGFFIWTHPAFQTPQGLGAVGATLGVVAGVRGAADKIVKRRAKPAGEE